MEYEVFQKTIASYGFFQFSGICLHRLDKPSIDKMKHLNGTSLWSMMNEFFKSEDLIRLVESKEVRIRC